ncbi:MAG: DEAD/DEAH box helicase family protein [Bacteroidales bacterium]|nr:DEAD/DEAH box helicase family protein [Bacteroidales bacterium]
MERIEFQESAVEQLLDQFKMLWKQPQRQIPITLKAPTGSGKTYMTEKFICELTKQPDWVQDVAFIWITFSDELAMQSRDKFKTYFPTSLPGRLLTIQDLQQGVMRERDIMFMNWQKLVSRKAEDRVLRRPADKRNEKESGYYFEDVVEQTHAEGREFILIIDESHKNVTEAAMRDVIKPIDPKIIVKVSATPETEPTASDVRNLRAGFVEVSRQDVIEAGMIKRELVCQTEESVKRKGNKDLDDLLLDLAMERRAQLVGDIQKFGFRVNPLVIIQLPNDSSVDPNDQTKAQIVTEYLVGHGVKPERIATWFSGEKKPLGLEENDSPYDYLLFKMAAGTGWDCPRAQVLVMFRDIQSEIFQTQTIGRIVRIPVRGKQGCEVFQTGYIYTNYSRKAVLDADYGTTGNKPKVNVAESVLGKELIIDELLQTEYMSRVDYGDLGKSWDFQLCLIQTFNAYFGITDDDAFDVVQDKLNEHGLRTIASFRRQIVVDAKFQDLDQISFESNGGDLSLEVSQNDVQKLFTKTCVDLLKEQSDDDAKITNIARSFSALKSALRLWMKKYAFPHLDDYARYRIFLADVIEQGAKSVFRQLVTTTLKNHYPQRLEQLKERRAQAEAQDTATFVIRKLYAYSDEYEPLDMKRCLFRPFYIGKNYDGRANELAFAQYLDRQENIEWWMKNGDSGRDWLSIRYFNEEENKVCLFYPDWIYKKKDGTIGIWDTKGGQTASSLETKNKAEALQLRIRQLNGHNRESIRYEGGIVVMANQQWYCNDNANYTYKQSSTDGWRNMNELFLSHKEK